MTATETSRSKTANSEVLSSALAACTRPARPSALSASLTFAWRTLLKIKHVPDQLGTVMVFPIMMTLIFTYLFGGALAGSPGEYLQSFLPGILVMAVVMISIYTAVALNADISKGIFDRFRSLPFWRPAVLVGALLGDTVRYTLAVMVVIVLGLVLGFRPAGGVVGVLLSLVLILVFAFSLSWIWTTLGLVMQTPESVTGVCSAAIFPLTFASNIFVEPHTMPSWLQAWISINPISHTVTAVRGLMHGTVTSGQIISALLACAVLIAVFAPLSMYLFRNKNTR